tara:strand:- start:414 stop:680 length:267 start_codon:yes stop_codon:yes gene_type:complete
MKLKQVIAIQEILDKRKIPVDMAEKWVYHSESRDEWVDIMELDVIHAIRILRKHMGKMSDEQPEEHRIVEPFWLDTKKYEHNMGGSNE